MDWNRRTRVWISSCLIVVALLWLSTTGAEASLPHHHITIWFDLTKHRLYGTVDATIPKSVETIVVGTGLKITRFTINGKATTSKVKDGHIQLPSHPDRTQVYLRYEAAFSGGKAGSFANMIGEEGSFLLSEWYPAADSELAYFSLEARVPRGFQAVSEADTVTTRQAGKERLVTFDFPHPVTNIHFIMAPYVVKRESHGNVEVATYLLPEDQGLAGKYMAYTKKYLEMYEEMLGPYPFKRFAVVENIMPTGYGMPTFTLLGRQVLKLPFIPETSLGHEVLHSWFGNSVYVDYASGNWSEGLTSYLADHHYAELNGKGWQYRKKIIEDYESYVHEDNVISVRDFTGGGDKALRAVGYGKIAMIFHMLQNRIGDKAFGNALKLLIKEQSFRLTSWDDLDRIFSKAAGQDLSGFFEFWLDVKGSMEVNLNQIRLNHGNKGYDLEFRIRVANSSMPLSVPVVIHTESEKQRQILSVNTSEQTFSFFLNDKPEEIVLDPDYDLFRNLEPAERRPVLSRLLGDPTRTVVLPETDKAIYEPLIQALKRRGFKSMDANKVKHSDLGEKAWLFLGSDTRIKSLFGKTPEPPTGFSLQIRKNVFNPKHVLGLAVAEDKGEVGGVVRKLFHYGHYSSLRFSKGNNVEKKTADSDRGMRMEVGPPVTGISLDTVLPLSEIISQVGRKTIVYVGEKHDRYGDHLIQLEVIRALHQRHPKLAIGMEMFQRRYQKALDDYIGGKTDEQTFLKESRYFSTWRFNYHLYRPILQFAREHGIPVVALNQDHELVGKIAEEGLEELSQEERARLPKEMTFDDEAYERRLRRVFEMHQKELSGDKAPQVFEYFHQAQILWDETMAESIATFLADRPDYHMVVLAGNGHLEYGSGIPKRAYRRIEKDYAIVLPDPGEPLEPGLADFVVFPSEVEAPEAAKLGVMLDTTKGKLEVAGLPTGSGAKEAGMEKGDIIFAVNDEKVKDIDELKASLATKQVGDRVRVKVRRDGKTVELTVELGRSRPMGR